MKRLIVLLFLAAMAHAKYKPADPVLVNGTAEQVRAATVAAAVAEGYAIESEGEFQIVFQKNMTGARGFLTSSLLSPPACHSCGKSETTSAGDYRQKSGRSPPKSGILAAHVSLNDRQEILMTPIMGLN